MRHFPIVFTFDEKVVGLGFWADVRVCGRALAEHNEDGWWFYGVEPGDVAAGARTFTEIRIEFLQAFRAILLDLANDARNYTEFKAAVQQWFAEKNGPVEQDWNTAHAAVRSGSTAVEGDVEHLPQVRDPEVAVSVTEIKQPRPQYNVLDHETLGLAA